MTSVRRRGARRPGDPRRSTVPTTRGLALPVAPTGDTQKERLDIEDTLSEPGRLRAPQFAPRYISPDSVRGRPVRLGAAGDPVPAHRRRGSRSAGGPERPKRLGSNYVSGLCFCKVNLHKNLFTNSFVLPSLLRRPPVGRKNSPAPEQDFHK